MAVKTRRRKKAGRRRYRRNAWFRQSSDHAIAAKLGWAYQPRRRKSGGRPRRYIKKRIGIRGLLRYRARHRKPAPGRASRRRMVSFRVPMFGRRYRLVANKRRRRSRRRYMDNARRRTPRRGKGGKFVSTRKRSRRSYRRNWFVSNEDNPKRKRRRSRRTRRSYKRNWFVYNDNAPRRRRRSRKVSHRRRRRYADNKSRRYMKNDVIGDALDTVKSVFDVEFLTGTALPVVGGFFAARAVSSIVGNAILPGKYVGIVKHLGNFVASGLTAAVAGFLLKDPQLAGNVLLGGVLNAAAGAVRELVSGIEIVRKTPALSEAFGLSGLGSNDIRGAVEREVMRELGVSDYLSAEQLSRAERVGDFLSAEQMGRAERIGQYPAETSGPAYLAQYPAETSGGAMADFADVASFGG